MAGQRKTSKDGAGTIAQQRNTTAPLRDVSDLCIHWSGRRGELESYLESAKVPYDVADTMRWMILLTDRVCRFEDVNQD